MNRMPPCTCLRVRPIPTTCGLSRAGGSRRVTRPWPGAHDRHSRPGGGPGPKSSRIGVPGRGPRSDLVKVSGLIACSPRADAFESLPIFARSIVLAIQARYCGSLGRQRSHLTGGAAWVSDTRLDCITSYWTEEGPSR